MRLLIIILLTFSAIVSCDKDDNYSSILGEWLVEDNGEVSAYHRYNVSIQRLQSDTSLYKIFNFYRTGNNAELIVELDGLDVIITGQSVGNYYIQGSGIVQSDFKAITLEYQVSGGSIYENVVSDFTRN